MSQSIIVLPMGPGDNVKEQRYLVVNSDSKIVSVLEVQANGSLVIKSKQQVP